MNVVWQPTLLDAASGPDVDASFSTLVRVQLDATSWVDHAPGWVTGSDELLARLIAETDWGQRSRWMYERRVAEPRLTASWSSASGRPLEPAVLERMREVLSSRYGVTLDSMGLNLYRDGRDSVAWHGDRIAREITEPIVALVSLGDHRRFLARPKGGGRSVPFELGGGDLLVTGGAFQRSWQHSVPKVAAAGARISIAFRHGATPANYPTG
ncbi:MAG TPA: alpha-ketoglutarate-dependent dioxygenase AlkB [Acidimicrobiales bacterium]|nr:alpha-ketoglutarate-dependent dioxygenase AlkB [Acidimicrobiales bacterium]